MNSSCRIEKKKLKDLIPAPYNPRRISEGSINGLGKSMEKFGLLSFIIWNERTDRIVGGHQRYKKLVEHGIEESDVIVVDLSETDEIALNIALNNPNSRGKYTRDAIGILEELEVTLGSMFNDLKLNDLHALLSKMLKEKKPKEPKEPKEPDLSGESESEMDAVVVCPKCSSKWRMKDDKVLKNEFRNQ